MHALAHRVFHIVIAALLGLLIAVPAAWSQGGGQLVTNTVEVQPQPAQCAYQVRAFVSVLDANRDPISNLRASDFTVVEDGTTVSLPADAVAPANQGMAIVVAIDKSGSMDRADKMPLAQQAVNDFLSRLQGGAGGDQVAIYSFDDEVNLEADLMGDPNVLINKRVVNSVEIKPFAGTCLYDAAFKAVEKAAEVRKGRRAVVLLTDGVDEARGGGPCSSMTVDDVIDRAGELSVPLYLIGLGEENVDQKVLQRMADRTNGQFWLAPDASELGGIYQRIADQLKNQLVVNYLSMGASGEHTLVIKAQIPGQGEVNDTVTFNAPAMAPAIAGLSLPDGKEVSGTELVRVNAPCAANIARAEFYVDGTQVGEAFAPPFEFNWDTSALSAGQHQLRAVVFNAQGQQDEKAASVIVVPPSLVTVTVSATMPPAPPATPVINGPRPDIIMDTARRVPQWALIVIPVLLFLAVGLIFAARRRRDREGFYPEHEIYAPIEEAATEDIFGDEPTEDVYAPEMPDPIAELVVVRSLELKQGESFDLFARSVRVGRGVDNDFIIPDGPVSRRHAELRFQNGQFSVHDVGSTYGTTVNGMRVPPEGMWLEDGDQVQFGTRTVLEYRERSALRGWEEPRYEVSDSYDSEETQRLGGERDSRDFDDYYDDDDDQDYGPTTERY